MIKQISQQVVLASAFFSGAASFGAEDQPVQAQPATANSIQTESHKSVIALAKDVGTLDGLLKAGDLLHKNYPRESQEYKNWQSHRSAIHELIEHATVALTKEPSTEQLKTLDLALKASTGTLELYLLRRTDENMNPKGAAQKPALNQQVVGVYDVAEFEGMKTGVNLLLPLMQRQLASTKLPEATQQRLVDALSAIGSAETPVDLNNKMRSFLSDPSATEDVSAILRDLQSLRKRPTKDLQEPIVVKDSATAWRDRWQEIVDIDKRPRLHPGGRTGHEQRSFAQLAMQDGGFGQIKKSAEILAEAIPAEGNEALVSQLRKIATSESQGLLLKQNPHPLETMKKATTLYEELKNQ